MIDRYARSEMKRVWSQENRYRAWLAVELAVCEAWGKLGRIPHEDLKKILSLRDLANIDVERIGEIEETTRHDVIAFLTWLEEKIGSPARYIHLGCTSSDIVDSANAILLREAGEIILKDLDILLKTLKRRAIEYKGVLCMGRTHGIHAEPTSFGLKLAGFYEEFKRERERFASALSGIEVGKISGAVGTYAFLSPEVEKIALGILNLKPDPHSTQIVQRDRHAWFFAAIALIGGSIERLSVELRHLQRTELLEAEEGFAAGQKGSSAMPHKKNPISAENLCGLSRVMRGNALAAMENQALWHERDISHSSVERIIMPDSTTLADYALTRLNRVLSNLVVHPNRMRSNMDLSYGLFYSQRVLTALIDAGFPRQKAYELVQKLAMTGWNERKSFPELARSDPDLRSALGDKLDDLFDASFYLQWEDYIFNRIFQDKA